MLYDADVGKSETLPSPEQLKNRIVIKAKKSKHANKEGKEEPSLSPNRKTVDVNESCQVNIKAAVGQQQKVNHLPFCPVRYFWFFSMIFNFTIDLAQVCGAASSPKSLFDLVNICQSISFESFSHSREKGIFSLLLYF